jgi:hypothetical protein
MHEAVILGEYFFVEALSKAFRALSEEPIEKVVTPYPEDSLPEQARHWRDGLPEEDFALSLVNKMKRDY